MAVDLATRYAQRVVAGKAAAGQLHRLACERHLRDLDERGGRGLIWTPKRVVDVQAFAGHCRHLQGRLVNQPIRLEDWQVFLLGSVVGWTREADGLRRFRTTFAEMPRGQGKSILAAVLALYMTFFDNEDGATSYCVATKRDQAKIVFDYCRKMVLRSPELRRYISAKQLYVLQGLAIDAKLEPLGADADTLDGLRPHFVCADEVHKQPTSAIIDVMQTGMGTREQPHLFEITTAGDLSQRESVWWAHRQYSMQLVERTLMDDTWFAFIVGADRDDDWTTEAVWRKANPNYGISVMPDDLARKCEQAKAMPSYQNVFRRLHLGQLVEQEHRYLSMTDWDDPACAAPVDAVALAGRPCWAGMDLSRTTDLTALVLVWCDPDGGVTVRPWFWLPADRVAKHADAVDYATWARGGFLETTPGNVVDYQWIRKTLKDIKATYPQLQGVAYDPWNATAFVQQLKDEDGFEMVKVQQGYVSLTAPTKRLGDLALSHLVRHGGHPVLRWNAANLAVEMDPAGNLKPSKRKSTERIDGMAALVTALAITPQSEVVESSLLIRVI